MNDHFQDNIYKCLLFRHVRVTELSKRVSREVDCTLYGMFNVKKKTTKKHKLKPPLLLPAVCFFHMLSSAV